MSWQSLGEPIPSGLEQFWYLPLQGQGGKLWIRLPFVAETQPIYLGIGNNNRTPPGRFKGQLATLEPFEQYLSFDVPPSLENPFLGIRFQTEATAIEPFYLLQEFPDMAFYSNQLAEIKSQLVPRLTAPPSLASGIQQWIDDNTGETVTLVGNQWLGEAQERSFVMAAETGSDAFSSDYENLPVSQEFHLTDLSKQRLQSVSITGVEGQSGDEQRAVVRYQAGIVNLGTVSLLEDWDGPALFPLDGRDEQGSPVTVDLNQVMYAKFGLFGNSEAQKAHFVFSVRNYYGDAS